MSRRASVTIRIAPGSALERMLAKAVSTTVALHDMAERYERAILMLDADQLRKLYMGDQ